MNVFILSLIGIGLTHGASVASSGTDCSLQDRYVALSCFFRITDFTQKVSELDFDEPSEIKEFKKSCDSLSNCLTSIKCNDMDKEGKEDAKKVQFYCSSVIYFYTEFSECSDKLEKINPTPVCYEKWNPFGTNNMNKAEEWCDNLYGEKNCLQKEIVETCGKKQWEGLRDHFIKANPYVKNCVSF